MKNQNYIKLLLTSLLLTSCFLFPKYKETDESKITDEVINDDFIKSLELVSFKKDTTKTEIDMLFFKTIVDVKYIKTQPLIDLMDLNENKVLNGLKYSFLLSPLEMDGEVKFHTGMSKGLAKTLVLEVKEEMAENIVIKDFYFVKKDGNPIGLEFNEPKSHNGIPHKAESLETGYKFAYNRGVLNSLLQENRSGEEALGKLIKNHYNKMKKKWSYMYLKIILEKDFDGKREYIVKINPYIFNELVKEFRKKYKQDIPDGNINNKNNVIPYLPVNDN